MIDPESDYIKTLQLIDLVITVIFIVEAGLKIVTFGFVKNGKDSYLKSAWNCLDFTIVVISFMEIALSSTEHLSTIKTLRIMRLLRPIRLIARNGTLRSAITSLLHSVPKILELIFMVTLFIFMFAMIEVYLFSGKFHYCFTDHLNLKIRQEQQLIANKWDC